VRPNREFFEVDEDQVKRVIQLAEVASLGAEEPIDAASEAVEQTTRSVSPTPSENSESQEKPQRINGLELLESFRRKKPSSSSKVKSTPSEP
jgi:hypothetical protein